MYKRLCVTCCHHSAHMSERTDVATGVPYSDVRHYCSHGKKLVPCADARRSGWLKGGFCGPQGKFYENKPVQFAWGTPA